MHILGYKLKLIRRGKKLISKEGGGAQYMSLEKGQRGLECQCRENRGTLKCKI